MFGRREPREAGAGLLARAKLVRGGSSRLRILRGIRSVTVLPGIALVAVGYPAAATPSARLVYVRSAEASSCPDEAALRGAVAARFGYDPFFAWAKQTVVVEVQRRGEQFTSRIQVLDAQGVAKGVRELKADGPSCSDLFDVTALAISIALDASQADVALAEPAAPPAAPDPPPPEPPARDAPAEVPSPEAPLREAVARRTEWLFGLDLLGSEGTAPTISAGVAAFGELRFGGFLSTALEARVDAPAVANAGDAHSWLYAAQIVPCVHAGPLLGCALGSLGQFVVSAAVASPSSGNALFAALGGRVGADLPLSRSFLLRAHADGLVDLAPPRYLLDGGDLWSAPRLAFTLGAGVAVRIP
jgi:hypothetical protein